MTTDPSPEPGRPEHQPEFAEVLRTLRQWPDATPPDLAPAVMSRIRQRRRLPLGIAALLAALLGAILAMLRIQPDPEALTVSASDPFFAEDAGVAAPGSVAVPSKELSASGGDLSPARAWLVREQDYDGGWSMGRTGAAAKYTVGTSALALLALAKDAAGAESRAAIERGLHFLVRSQQPSGVFGPDITGSFYNHALACLALLRAGDATDSDAACARALRRGLDVIAAAQRPEGGWTYLRSRGAANSSITAWALQVLMEARAQGAAHHSDAIERGLAWLDRTVDKSGRAGYRRSGDHPHGSETLTAAAALCFLEYGNRSDPRMARMIENIRRDIGDTTAPMDLYRTFFQAAALRAEPQPDEELATVAARLRAAQELAGEDAGSWPPLDRWSSAGGRVYSTSLALLALNGG